MNFIFDIGNVLMAFNPTLFLKQLHHDPRIENKLLETIFKSNLWVQLDHGTITTEDAIDQFCRLAPGYEEPIQKTIAAISEVLTPIPETIRLLPEIKAKGHKLYYLSNMLKVLSEQIISENSFFEYFDGGMFSCDVKLLKPDPAIYLRLLDQYQLEAGDCLFTDDTPANVEAAQELGMHGVIFTEASCLKPFI